VVFFLDKLPDDCLVTLSVLSSLLSAMSPVVTDAVFSVDYNKEIHCIIITTGKYDSN